MRPNGYTLYSGPSLLTGDPIVVIATGFARSSKNAKTGEMIQTWILRADKTPLNALADASDSAICGDCPHRGTSCYVNVAQAPQAVYRAWKRGSYPELTDYSVFAGHQVRFGAYGDPMAAPFALWMDVASQAAGWTGYTHQWRKPHGLMNDWRILLMASADSPADMADAHAAGWRTFRTRTEAETLTASEIACPAADEAGSKTQCARCGLCNGAQADIGKPKQSFRSIAIIAHGAAHKVKRYESMRLAA